MHGWLQSIDASLRSLTWTGAAALFLAGNTLIFVASVASGICLASAFARRRITAPPPQEALRLEGLAAASAVVLNSGVTLAGWALWRAGIIRFRTDTGLYAWLDVLVLLLVMDVAMYVLHRVAHARVLFPLLHALHHRFDRPRPLTLFALNPVETLSFGGLWLAVIAVYPASWLGMSVYLVLNVAFGTVGHVGVEPLPRAWVRWPILRHIGTSTFHAQHHARRGTNFGFYTLVWDRLFRTLDPEYEATFATPLGPRSD